MIHPTAIVDPSAKIPSSCMVGPYCIVGPDVELGEDCELMANVIIHGPAHIGSHNRFFPFCAIGMEPQDTTFAGEKTKMRIGDHNIFHEYVTINHATTNGCGITTVASHVLLSPHPSISPQ